MTSTPQWDFRIEGTRPDGPDPTGAIDGFYGHAFDPISQVWGPWGAWNAYSISRLKIAGHKVHTMVEGMRAEVIVRWTQNAEPYLTTSADDVLSNNLSKLPWSRLVSIADPPSILFDTQAYVDFLEFCRQRTKNRPSRLTSFGAR